MRCHGDLYRQLRTAAVSDQLRLVPPGRCDHPDGPRESHFCATARKVMSPRHRVPEESETHGREEIPGRTQKERAGGVEALAQDVLPRRVIQRILRLFISHLSVGRARFGRDSECGLGRTWQNRLGGEKPAPQNRYFGWFYRVLERWVWRQDMDALWATEDHFDLAGSGASLCAAAHADERN